VRLVNDGGGCLGSVMRIMALAGLLMATALAGCGLLASPPPDPPVIDHVAVPTDVLIGQTVQYTFTDGAHLEVDPATYRTLTPHGWGVPGGLVIVGSDTSGLFVAAFSTQEGMPADCYVENAPGRARGAYIETRGVLWAKDPSVPTRDDGSAYGSGTRFCFNERGVIDRITGS